MRTYKYYIYKHNKGNNSPIIQPTIYRTSVRFGISRGIRYWDHASQCWYEAFDQVSQLHELPYAEFINSPWSKQEIYAKMAKEWAKHANI